MRWTSRPRATLALPDLNAFLAAGRSQWQATRHAVSAVLSAEHAPLINDPELQTRLLLRQCDVEMRMPARVGDYTDFYCSIHHATNVGSMFRPDNPLMPNYKHLPVGYHGRASSLMVSGAPVRRPHGQTVAADGTTPSFGASRLLDYELEMGFFVGRGNPMGERITMAAADEHIFGLCVVNDWSARDVQKWEYQPLGPFNAKNFATSISPWIVTVDALAPYRKPQPPRGAGDPDVLAYLQPGVPWGFDVSVEVHLSSEKMRTDGTAPMLLSRGNFHDMYWSIAQMLVHHTSTGCNVRPGDLIASGTVSGPSEDARGCLLELTWRGQNPITLSDGTERRFLQDGDEGGDQRDVCTGRRRVDRIRGPAAAWCCRRTDPHYPLFSFEGRGLFSARSVSSESSEGAGSSCS